MMAPAGNARSDGSRKLPQSIMTGPSPAPPRPEWVPSAALVVIAVAPAAYGCQPPWASGFLTGALLLLAAAHILYRSWRGQPWGWGSRALALVAFLCLGWLTLGVARDWLLGPQQGRVPALSTRELTYAGAFLGAAILGGAYCHSVERLRTVCRAVTWLGVVLSCFALAEVWGHDIKTLTGWELASGRASGLYTNPNRFAVLLCCCWMCGAAVLLERYLRRGEPGDRRRLEPALLAAGMLAISAALALTLSRLTLLSMAAALGLATCLCLLSRRGHPAGDEIPLTPVEKIRRAALLALPVLVVAAWGTWCLFVGTTPMRNRMAALDTELTLGSRVLASKAAWPLLQAQPVWGWGLGTFESVFTSVLPANLPGRWQALHNDWLQLAIEAGVPAVALTLLLFGTWCHCVWQRLRAAPSPYPLPQGERGDSLLRILPGAGILVTALCSVGDFPLREPATAALVFFLAGGLCAASLDSTAQAARVTTPVYRTVGGLLAVPLLLGAWLAGQSGLAYSLSPWMWHIACPARSSRQQEAWSVAARMDSGDPELHYRLAAAAFAGAGNSQANLAVARDAARRAAALQPYDHRFPWMESAVAQALGEVDEMFRLRELAATLAPSKPALREQNGRLYLYYAVTQAPPGDPRRDESLEHAVESFAAVLKGSPLRETEIVRAMEDAGCLNDEIAALWPGETAGARLHRARFYCERRQWDWVERNLPAAEAVGEPELRWYYAIRGTMELRRGTQDSGCADWKRAISPGTKGYDGELDAWLADQARGAGTANCEELSRALLPELGRFPTLAAVTAQVLMQDGRWAACDRLLEQVAEKSPDLTALWAEVALAMGDPLAASLRARAAWEQDLSSARRSAWYGEFQQRLRERRR